MEIGSWLQIGAGSAGERLFTGMAPFGPLYFL